MRKFIYIGLAAFMVLCSACSKESNMAEFAVSWPRMGVDAFGCMMEKRFGHRDERFNCSLIGYENKGDPCNNTGEYYEGFSFPDHLVKKVHPQLSGISLSWEHGDLQMIIFSFDGEFKKEQVLNTFGLSQENPPDNIYIVNAEDNSLVLIGFEHMGAGDVDCEDEIYSEPATEADDDDGIDCPGNAKLPKSIADDGHTTKFKYDDKNRIIKITSSPLEYRFNYSDDKLVEIKAKDLAYPNSISYTINGNTIKYSSYGKSETITTNNDGYIFEREARYDGGCGAGGEDATYQYQDGNLIKIVDTFQEACGDEEEKPSEPSITEFKYDNEKSPFYYSKTPKWVIQQQHFTSDYANKNNIIEVNGYNARSYKYEYDSDGFPTKRISGSETITFTYCEQK